MKRKLILLAAGFIAACAVFAGCAGKSAEKIPDAAEAAAQESYAETETGSDWAAEYLSDDSVKEKYPFCRYADVNGDGSPPRRRHLSATRIRPAWSSAGTVRQRS